MCKELTTQQQYWVERYGVTNDQAIEIDSFVRITESHGLPGHEFTERAIQMHEMSSLRKQLEKMSSVIQPTYSTAKNGGIPLASDNSKELMIPKTKPRS